MSRDVTAYLIDDTKALFGIRTLFQDDAVVTAELAAIEAANTEAFAGRRGEELREAVRTLLGAEDTFVNDLPVMAFERAFQLVCRHYSTERTRFTNAPWSFEDDVDTLLEDAGVDLGTLSFERLMGTPCYTDETGEEGDYVVTVHTAAEVKEIAALLSGLDLSEAGDFEDVAGWFAEAREAGRGLAIFLH